MLVATGLLKQIGPDRLACTYRSLGYRSDNATNFAFNMTWVNFYVVEQDVLWNMLLTSVL